MTGTPASLSDEELERYARHIVLKDVGGIGQMRLRAGTVAVLGMGGIGSPAIQYLAAAGVGTLLLIDDDVVELSNLQRQTIFGIADLGREKVAAAADAVARLNPGVRVVVHAQRLDANNAHTLIEKADVVLDGSDSFATRLAVADAALALKVPLVSAAVSEFEGQLGVYRGWESDKPCYRCFAGSGFDRAGATCAETGILGALAGTMGSLAALESIRILTGFGDDAAGKLLLVSGLSGRFRSLAVPKSPACAACV